MSCPYCGYKESKVVDSRPADEGSSTRRRRDCLQCEKRCTTYETVDRLPMLVINKDGSISSPKVVKSVDPLLDNEAMRVIKMMPRWKPGMDKGVTCRTMFAIPVNFVL